MRHLDPMETEFFLEGEGEVQEKLAELGIKTDGEIAPRPRSPLPPPPSATFPNATDFRRAAADECFT